MISQCGWSQVDSADVRHWGVGVDATSFLNYIGNLANNNAAAPTWQNVVDGQPTIEYLRFENDNTYNRFQLGVSIKETHSKVLVPQLNESGDTIINAFFEDEYTSAVSRINFRYSREKWVGEKRLRGHLGYFSSFGLTKFSEQFSPQNALNHHIGNTLFYDPGRVFQFAIGITGGVNFNISDNLLISSSIDFGIHYFDQRNGSIREVVFDPILSDDPFIQNTTGLNSNADWNIDFNYKPNLTLTFLF